MKREEPVGSLEQRSGDTVAALEHRLLGSRGEVRGLQRARREAAAVVVAGSWNLVRYMYVLEIYFCN